MTDYKKLLEFQVEKRCAIPFNPLDKRCKDFEYDYLKLKKMEQLFE